jgi:hypothetical protein
MEAAQLSDVLQTQQSQNFLCLVRLFNQMYELIGNRSYVRKRKVDLSSQAERKNKVLVWIFVPRKEWDIYFYSRAKYDYFEVVEGLGDSEGELYT